jgi:anaerobic magnesium-protoporphyrin IX monomethyl ester cyclase
MGIKVLFIYPNTFGMNMLPPALALFSALLKRDGHQVDLFDATYYDIGFGVDSDGTKMSNLNVKPFDMGTKGISLRDTDWRSDLQNKVDTFKPDLIALSTTEDMWELGIKLLNAISENINRNAIPVIAGGVFPTFAPDLVLRHPLISMVCVGEGENALTDLCGRIEGGVGWSDVTNLWVKSDNGTIIKNPVSRPVDIDQLPRIDIGLFDESRLYRPMAGKIYKMFPVETIRGCPYKCAFCNSPSQIKLYNDETESNFLRKKSIENIHAELKYFKESLGVEYNYFWADTFLALSRRELEAFCEMYSDIGLPFWMQTRPETIKDEYIKRLSEVGLHRISFGIEHGNEEFRRTYLNRPIKNEAIIDALRIPGKYGVRFSVNNITGFPHETRELAMDTVELNRRIDSDNQNIYSYVPFHGTPLREVCEKMGLIHPDTITKCLMDKPVITLPNYSEVEIEGLKKCFVLYVKLPKNRWSEIRRAEANDAEGNRIFEALKEEC